MLTSVACIVRTTAQLTPLIPVHALINEFLDVSAPLSLPNAAATGSVPLFKRVLSRVLQASDADAPPLLRYHWLGRALAKAIEHDHLAIVKCIHEAHPAPLGVRSFQVAAQFGRLEIFQWLCDHRCDGLCIDVPPAQKDPQVMRCCFELECELIARANRHVHVLRWLYERGYSPWMGGTGDVAAAQGDLEMVQWLHDNSIPSAFMNGAIDGAVKHGHLTILQYLHERGYESAAEDLLMHAVVRGHMQVAEFLAQQSIGTSIDSEVLLVMAAEHGRVDLLERLQGVMSSNLAVREDMMQVAVANGQLLVAQWLGPHHVNATALQKAARQGYLAMLQWVHEQDCGEWTPAVVNNAVTGGVLEILQWLQQTRPSLFADSEALALATVTGNLPMTKWLEQHGHVHGPTAVRFAAMYGHFDVVKWLHSPRHRITPESTNECTLTVVNSAQRRHLEMSMWLHTHGYHAPKTTTIEMEVLDVMMWFYKDLEYPIHDSVVTKAAQRGNFALVKWLYTHSDFRADASDHPYLHDWIQEHR